MLDAYIIEELKRQEEARRRAEDARDRPRVEYEAPRDPDPGADETDDAERDEDATDAPVLHL